MSSVPFSVFSVFFLFWYFNVMIANKIIIIINGQQETVFCISYHLDLPVAFLQQRAPLNQLFAFYQWLNENYMELDGLKRDAFGTF